LEEEPHYRGAIADYNKAIEIDPNYKDAYFSRAIAKIISNQKDSGCLDFSKAGELGMEEAYDAIQKFCK
jgi:tetratricopeptide (TPR) repeat protein